MQVIMKVKQRKHLQQQEKIMTNIVIYGTCQEMHLNGPQNTLPTLALASSTLVLVVEGITAQFLAEPAITRLAAATLARLAVSAIMVYVPYFM